MTSIVGILCSDGIVIGSDSTATYGANPLPTIEQEIKKIEVIGNDVIVAGTGEVGLNQRFCYIVRTEHDQELFGQNQRIPIGVKLANLAIRDFSSTGVQGGHYGALLAYTNGDDYHLCEFSTQNLQPEWKDIDNKLWFVSMGCGQSITDPFLGLMRRVFWKDAPPTVADAIFVATWTLQHAIELNTGGINGPIQMAVIRKNKELRYEATVLTNEELLEHQNNIVDAEEYLANYKKILLGLNGDKEIPSMSED